jgi:hypothetical protein
MFAWYHMLVRKYRTIYEPLLIDRDSHNLNLIIRPLYCDDPVTDPNNCIDEGTIFTVIFNK